MLSKLIMEEKKKNYTYKSDLNYKNRAVKILKFN